MSRLEVDVNEVKYWFMCQMAERIVTSGGIIFGGFLRDKIIRDHYKKTYDEVDISSSGTLRPCMALPKNVDVIFVGNAEELRIFYEEIMMDDVDLESKVDSRPHPFLKQGFRHSTDLIMKNSKQILGAQIEVHLDLLVSPVSIDLLRSDHDLDCNVLICDRNGIRTSFDPKTEGGVFKKFTREQEVIKRIIDRKTSVLPVDEGRPSAHLQSALKMMLRDWVVTNISSFQVVDAPGPCLFCQEGIQEKAVRMNCCMKYAHSDCFSRFLGNPDHCFFSRTGCRHDNCFDLTD